MRSTALVVVLSSTLGACRGAELMPAPHDRGGRALRDTVSIIAAAWLTAAGGHEGRRATWLHLPGAGTPGFTASPAVRAALRQRGVPASERAPAGDDTVVFRVGPWTRDSGGATRLELHSHWTTVLGAGRRRCRTGSGNLESYRVVRSATGWTAEQVGPVVHGDRVCAPIP